MTPDAVRSPLDASGDRSRYVFHPLPRCPLCDSQRLLTTRSQNQQDGSRKRWTTCRDCGWRFFLILE